MMSGEKIAINSGGSEKPKRMLDVSLEKRLEDTKRYSEKYPDLVPVVITAAPRSRYSNHHDYRYLFGKDTTIGAVCANFRAYLDLKPHEALFFTVKDIIPPNSAALVEVYEVSEHYILLRHLLLAYKSEDNYLYFTYREEDVFGAGAEHPGDQDII